MDIFVEYFDGDFAVCRLPDKEGNLIKLPKRTLPADTKELSVITMRDNGSMFINDYAREIRMKRILKYLDYKKYTFVL